MVKERRGFSTICSLLAKVPTLPAPHSPLVIQRGVALVPGPLQRETVSLPRTPAYLHRIEDAQRPAPAPAGAWRHHLSLLCAPSASQPLHRRSCSRSPRHLPSARPLGTAARLQVPAPAPVCSPSVDAGNEEFPGSVLCTFPPAAPSLAL